MGRPINLPASFASFVGRERQIEELQDLVAAYRLVTLTGPPGVGKSRLAVQVANRLRTGYQDGIWMVELAELDEPTLAASATALALGVREADQAPIDALLDELRDRELLLLLDNYEHLLDACTALTEALLTPLDQVDRRLGGLMARLNAYRITEAPMALVMTGLVSEMEDPPSVGWRVTPRALWEMAKEMLKQGGHLCEPVYGLGEDAFLTLRGTIPRRSPGSRVTGWPRSP